jgi:hypothetical protein
MSLLTPADLQALGIGLDLTDAALQSVIDAEEAELVRRFGPNYPGPQTETVSGRRVASLYLKRAIVSVTSITEYLFLGDTAPVTLVAGDYLIWNEEGRIQRVPTGPNGAGHWGYRATVVYVPADDTVLRKSVLTELVRIGVEQPATSGTGESVSGLTFSIGKSVSGAPTYTMQRAAAYARLGWLSQ